MFTGQVASHFKGLIVNVSHSFYKRRGQGDELKIED